LLANWRARRIARSLNRIGANGEKAAALFSGDRSDAMDMPDQIPAAEVLHLHWISGIPQFGVGALIDQPTFFNGVNPSIPMVWTFHDLNPITGGCHYPGACDRYRYGCGQCPQLSTRGRPEVFTSALLKRKRRMFKMLEARPLAIVANSRWTAAQAGESRVLRGLNIEIQVIFPGVDLASFRPAAKEACRRALGLDPDTLVVCFGAAAVLDPVKGMDLLREALEGSKFRSRIHLLTFGNGGAPDVCGLPIKHVGTVTNDTALAKIYSAADVFVAPSRMEAFGQTAAEAVACGIPVVGTPVGGIPEIVRHGETGLIARECSGYSLRVALDELLSDAALRSEFSARCRTAAVKLFDSDVQAKRYVEVYNKLSTRESRGLRRHSRGTE